MPTGRSGGGGGNGGGEEAVAAMRPVKIGMMMDGSARDRERERERDLEVLRLGAVTWPYFAWTANKKIEGDFYTGLRIDIFRVLP